MALLICRRLLWTTMVVLGVSILMFVLSHLVPADPARLALGLEATEDQVARMRELMGLDKPLLVQYFRYVKSLARGDLGVSVRNQRPVREDILTYLPATLELALVSTVLYAGLGIPLGMLAALRRGGGVDLATRIGSVIGNGMPSFWLALVLQVVLFRNLGWLPSGGRLDPLLAAPPHVTGLYIVDSMLAGQWHTLATAVRHLIMPAFTLALGRLAVTIRVTRRSFLAVLRQDYIRTARAKGVPEYRINFRHVLRNSLIPVVTILGLQVGQLLSGTVLVETIFSWPGIGKYAVEAISFMDYQAIMGVALTVCLIFVVINLGVDILYTFLDPRIRY